MAETSVDDRQLEQLRRTFRGEVIAPEQEQYDEARTLFNSMVDKRPAVIAQCADTDDVVRALAFAREAGLEVAVRGGGHSVAGKALVDDGLVIDLRAMNAVSVDPDARTATVGGGATMSHLDRATEPFGLATTGGRVSTTGVGGFTLGGGTGWLDRKLGFACDRLLSVDLVRADGQQLRASEDENPELFWALHGGGGNFGVATSFTFRLDPLPVMTAALMVWPAESGPAVLRRYRDVIESGPDDVGGGFFYLTGPPEDFIPAELVDQLICFVLVTYTGPQSEAQPFIDAMAELRPAGTMVAEMPYADMNSMLDDPPGQRNYWSAEQLAQPAGRGGRRLLRPGRRRARPVVDAARPVPAGRRLRSGSERLAHAVPQRALGGAPVRRVVGPGRRRPLPTVGAGRAHRDAALGDRRRLPQLHRRRGRGPARRGVRAALPAARPRQGRARPGQRLPRQPQHQAGADRPYPAVAGAHRRHRRCG